MNVFTGNLRKPGSYRNRTAGAKIISHDQKQKEYNKLFGAK